MTEYLSIIVPVYNIEQYLSKCIESILEQTLENIEVILVDDGSTDNSGDICDDYARKDSRIKVIHKKNGGLVSARKAGLEVASGKYVGYVDGDDWIDKSMYQILWSEANEKDADIVICDFYEARNEIFVCKTQSVPGGIFDRGNTFDVLIETLICQKEFFEFGLLPCVWNKIYKRDLLTSKQFLVDNQIKLGEDAACSYPCLVAANRVVYLKEQYLYYYRIRTNSISHSMCRLYGDEIALLADCLGKDFEQYNNEHLMCQLYKYIGHMIDNMITSNLRFRISYSALAKECTHLMKNEWISSSIQYCNKIETSSRMKRIVKYLLTGRNTALIELLMFRMYENMRKIM